MEVAMNLVSGNTLWNNKTDIPYKYPYISKDINCDVLVIGAGITGAICSYYFSMDGIDTVLVEKILLVMRVQEHQLRYYSMKLIII